LVLGGWREASGAGLVSVLLVFHVVCSVSSDILGRVVVVASV
jgi:hypothetical protein